MARRTAAWRVTTARGGRALGRRVIVINEAKIEPRVAMGSHGAHQVKTHIYRLASSDIRSNAVALRDAPGIQSSPANGGISWTRLRVVETNEWGRRGGRPDKNDTNTVKMTRRLSFRKY